MEVAGAPDPTESGLEEGHEGGGDVPVEKEEEPRPTAAVDSAPEVSEGSRVEGWEGLAQAISSTLGKVIRDFNSTAEGAARSQDVLSLSLDRLTAELDKLLEDAPLPFIMQHAAKISSIRKRVSALNSVLTSIQQRIDNMDRLISTGSSLGMGPRTSRSS